MAEDTGVRDKLAKDRTDLANERTLLAYLRTALAFFLAGGFLLRFETSNHMVFIAVALLFSGIAIVGFGTQRFVIYKRRISKKSKNSNL